MKMARIGKRCTIVLLLLVWTFVAAGCSVQKTVRGEPAKSYRDRVKALSATVLKTDVTFTRPSLSIDITLSGEPDDDLSERILQETRSFVTVENMERLAENIGWGLEISKVRLSIRQKGNQAGERRYHARYFRTSDASDTSEANIEGYRIWYPHEG